MTRPRSSLVCVLETPWYHVVSRCVRRAFLCGHDHYSGQSFEHRRSWVEKRVLQLAAVFAVDVAAYAVMSNHYHIVLRIDPGRAAAWSDEEVLRRWTQLFTGPLLVQRALSIDRGTLSAAELATVAQITAVYRGRLADLSWFMRVLNERIARQANEEDKVKGHFWEGRFKSQALLDEQAILSAMAYVDLNPVRAGMAERPEESEYTSIWQRLQAMNQPAAWAEALEEAPPVSEGEGSPSGHPQPQIKAPLLPFVATTSTADYSPGLACVPFAFDDYLELVDTVGRAVHPRKRGHIPEHAPKILARLGIDAESFIRYASRFLKEFGSAVGAPRHLAERAARGQAKYLRGMYAARRVFASKAA
ncbi:MAG: hypothetical protein KUL75_07310 [Sterolibacterium sp.]|nr:hypothetical protein [Sterolibacterium sp.]